MCFQFPPKERMTLVNHSLKLVHGLNPKVLLHFIIKKFMTNQSYLLQHVALHLLQVYRKYRKQQYN